jgi:uncharacterized protein YheU (UPF0270 family)
LTESPQFVEVPFQELSPATLTALIEAYVLREGTDYGHSDYKMESKVEQVLSQLKSGKAKIFYNLAEESFDIILADKPS